MKKKIKSHLNELFQTEFVDQKMRRGNELGIELIEQHHLAHILANYLIHLDALRRFEHVEGGARARLTTTRLGPARQHRSTTLKTIGGDARLLLLLLLLLNTATIAQLKLLEVGANGGSESRFELEKSRRVLVAE